MSNIYIQEPPTVGKVLLVTTVGDIDIELWSKEAPKACRNFIQLGMEGYYNGTIFHRVVKGFIAQGGDPTGTGTGGESVYGEPFKDEFHSRLRFVRRGLVAMANSGKDDNGSQFFFTFAECPELQNKNTIFGKVVGETIYNMLKLEDLETDENETPLYPQKIIRMEILNNPFPDIVPRSLPPRKEKEKEKKKKEKVKTGVKNFKLLSFGEEAEEDEEESKEVSLALAGKGKSTHDVLNDPKLSSVPALEKDKDELSGDEELKEDDKKGRLNAEDVKKKLATLKRERKPEKFKKAEGKVKMDDEDDNEYEFGKEEAERKKQKLEEIAKEIQMLKKDYQKNRKQEDARKEEKARKEESAKREENDEKAEDNEVIAEYRQNLEKYRSLKSNLPKKGSSRESMTLKLLEGFKKKLQAIKDKSEENEGEEKMDTKEKKEEEEEENDNESWLAHKLNFEGEAPVLAKDANLKNDEWFDITDPRNALNKRRREMSKANQKKISSKSEI